MSDREIINEVADLFVRLGGDAEGFLCVWREIYETIKKLESTKTNESEAK